MFTYNTEWYSNNQLNQLCECAKQIELSAEKIKVGYTFEVLLSLTYTELW